MTINELREKRNQAWEAAKAFVEAKKDKDGLLSDADRQTYAQMEQKVKDYGAEIERMERQEAIDREMSAATSTPITAKPAATAAKQDTKTGRAADAYKNAFWDVTRSKEPVTREVRNALQVGVDTEGGYLVPDEFEHTLVQALGHKRIIRDHAFVFQTNSGSHKIPVVTNKGSAAWCSMLFCVQQASWLHI